MAAGKYSTLFAWFRRSEIGRDEFNEPRYQFQYLGKLWANVDVPSSSPETRYSTEVNVVLATVAIRQYPSVKPEDLLVDVEWDVIYRVLNTHRGDNEVIVDVEGLAEATPPVLNWSQDMSGGLSV